MGILCDAGYWANVANAMWGFRPPSGKLLTHDDAGKFLDIFCHSLTELMSDKNIYNDLEILRDAASREINPLNTTAQLQLFIEEFKRAEASLLLQSGVNFDVVADIIASINEIFRGGMPVGTTDHIIEDLRRTHHDVCGILRHKLGPIEHVTHHTWQIVKGVSLIGIDAGAAATAATIGEVVGGSMAGGPAPASVAFGCAIVAKARSNLKPI